VNSGDLQGREFAWTNSDFVKVQSLIYQRAGINLHDGKHAMVYSRLSRRLRETGFQSFRDYLDWLERHDGTEWQEFINALTTNLTSFFRESHHFQILRDYLSRTQPGSSWSGWCSAASTGEEPYSITMTAMDVLGAGARFSLTASDIDSKVLASASQGMYRLEDVKGLTDYQLKTYFLRGKGGNNGLVRIKPDVRSLVNFIPVNLIEDNWPFRNQFDFVFCRNVMIYFDATTQRQVLEKIYRVLAPGGLLFVGHAENFSDSKDLFLLKGKTVYERC